MIVALGEVHLQPSCTNSPIKAGRTSGAIAEAGERRRPNPLPGAAKPREYVASRSIRDGTRGTSQPFAWSKERATRMEAAVVPGSLAAHQARAGQKALHRWPPT